MSFKREGNDQSQLNVLKKRRVADLLANFIPEDEAALMKNGRYTCLVCSHRPIFDTVDMLTVHRKGKKHLEGMKWFYRKKTQLQRDFEKHHHHSYVAKEEEQQEASSSAPLLTQTRKITHHALLKATPYSSCHKRSSTKTEQEQEHSNISSMCQPIQDGSRHSSHQTQGASSNAKSSTASDTSAAAGHQHGERKGEVKKRGPQQNDPPDGEPMTEQHRKELEHYLKLKSDGWLRDRSGNWIKDENVEFDSDEDEPPPVSQT
ncbi:sodium channel modifier 1 [Alosa sapidissima]|uniref:sodium channel modifier 1 n=1 Tax=Alosa sapidissima TaxID=34773 RepID=UPI001C0A068D|nr:sodium channel modifier 1 [Alosa sapidissima]